jgi:hypothetical protein
MANGDPPSHDPRPLLRGWKEVAGHLHVSVRTAQRLSESDGLPIYRTGHQKGGVSAYPAELDAWLKGRDGLALTTHDVATEPPGPDTPQEYEGGAGIGGASDDFGRVDEAEPHGAVAEEDARSWFTRRRLVLGGLGALVAVAALVAVIASGTARSGRGAADGLAETAAHSLDAGQRGSAARDFRIRVRFGEHAVADLLVREGKRNLVLQTPAKQALYVEPELRGQSLHVVLYERASGLADDAPLDIIGKADLVRSSELAALPVRFMVDGGWFELEWVR